MDDNLERVCARVEDWLEDAVIGLNLCPFAAKPYRAGRVELDVSDARSLEDAVFDAVEAAFDLLETATDDVSTTLVIYPHALSDFADYLDAADALRATLDDAGARGALQVATFHPDYQFADAAPDAVENATNRAPYPILHLLREDEVSDAVDAHPDPESIPARNIARMRELGRETLAEIWEEFAPE